jgi:hypothetical protein
MENKRLGGGNDYCAPVAIKVIPFIRHLAGLAAYLKTLPAPLFVLQKHD